MNKSIIPVALVTGAGRGIGRGIAIQLSESGFSVAINFRNKHDTAKETAKLCRQKSKSKRQRFFTVKGDISIIEEREQLVEEVLRSFGRIDALINNAGIAPTERKDILEAEEHSFEQLLRVNLQGPYFLTQQVVRYWLTKRPQPYIKNGFKVVFITSISAEMVSLNRGDYCISKAGLSMAAKLWAIRLASENIQVYEVRPGIIDTDMTNVVKEKYDALIENGIVPQRRWGIPEDIGRVVQSLLNGDFNFSSGSLFHVDGGLHIAVL